MKLGPLDKVPAPVRHLLLVLLVAALDAAAGQLHTLPVGTQHVLAPIVTFGLAFLTPLTRQYGVGKKQ